jgi:TIR domain
VMTSIEVFCCYAHEDAPHLENLKNHLTLLRRQGLITIWSDTDISPGSNWEQEIEKHLNAANIIVLLVSSDFMASDYCYSKEMFRSIERHDRGEAIVIPIILRPVYWQGAPFAKLQALPTGAKPIISSIWHNLDEALVDVVNGIGEAIKYLQTTSSARNNQLREYISREVRRGRPISEVLIECDPILDTLFQAIIEAASGRISEVIRMGTPTRKALKDCSPGLEYLLDRVTSQVPRDNSDAVLQTKIEDLVAQASVIADNDLRVQLDVTPDVVGVIADIINYLIEELGSLVVRVQMISTSEIESTKGTIDAIQASRKEIETIYKTVAQNNVPLSESARTLIADQAKQFDRFLINMEKEAERHSKLMDQLYASVASFRLRQNLNYYTDDSYS